MSETLSVLKFYSILFLIAAAATAAKSLQSCPTLCDPTDGSPPTSLVPGILQARTLEWVAISFSNAWKWKLKVKLLSRVRLLATPWIAVYQAPPSMGFSRQEYWSGVPLPSPFNCYLYQLKSFSSHKLVTTYSLKNNTLFKNVFLSSFLGFQKIWKIIHFCVENNINCFQSRECFKF